MKKIKKFESFIAKKINEETNGTSIKKGDILTRSEIKEFADNNSFSIEEYANKIILTSSDQDYFINFEVAQKNALNDYNDYEYICTYSGL